MNIYVSINEGNDSWTGQEPNANTHGTGPLKTIEKALSLASDTDTANQTFTIILREGTYNFSSPLSITSSSSGDTQYYPLEFKSYNDEVVKFSSANTLDPTLFNIVTSSLDSITYNRLHPDAKGNVYVYNLGSNFDFGNFTSYWNGDNLDQSDQITNTCNEYLPPYNINQQNCPGLHKGAEIPAIPELIVDDELYSLCRWPSEGYVEIKEVVEAGSAGGSCTCIGTPTQCRDTNDMKYSCLSNTADCNYSNYTNTSYRGYKPLIPYGIDGIFRYDSAYDAIISRWPNPSTNEMFVYGLFAYDWYSEGMKILDINKTNRTIKINSHRSKYGIIQFNVNCYARSFNSIASPASPGCDCRDVNGVETIPLQSQKIKDCSTGAVTSSYMESNDAELTRKQSLSNQRWRQGYWADNHPRRWFALNILEELNSPGQYYIDRTNKKLYIWPKTNITPTSEILLTKVTPFASDNSSTTYESKRNQSIIKIINAKNIKFNSIHICNSSGNGIDVIRSENITFKNCKIYNIRKTGIRIMGGKNNKIDECSFYDIGKGSILLGGGDKVNLIKANHIVENCDITRTGIVRRIGGASIECKGIGNIIRRNKIYNISNQAIFLYGNDHIVEYNNIYDVILECDDCGAIYSWSNISNRGTLIRYNLFRNIQSPLKPAPNFPSANVGSCNQTNSVDPNGESNLRNDGWFGHSAIYFDNYSSGYTVYGNIFYKCGNKDGKFSFGAIFANNGIDHVVNNNIFIDCPLALGSNPNVAYYLTDSVSTINSKQVLAWETLFNDKSSARNDGSGSWPGNFNGWGVLLNWNGVNLKDPNTLIQNQYAYEDNNRELGSHLQCDIRSNVYKFYHPNLMGEQSNTPTSFLYFDTLLQKIKVNPNYPRKNYANLNVFIQTPYKTSTYNSWNQVSNTWITTNDQVIQYTDDAGFVDIINGDFTLKEDSPIRLNSNFKLIPVEKIAGYYEEVFNNTLVDIDLQTIPLYYGRLDGLSATWRWSAATDNSTIEAESAYLKDNLNTKKYIMVYQRYYDALNNSLNNSSNEDTMVATFKQADLTNTISKALIRAAEEYNEYILKINQDTVNGTKSPMEHMGDTPLIVFDFETPIYSSILGWWTNKTTVDAKFGSGTWDYAINFAKGMIPKAKQLLQNTTFRTQNNIPDIFLTAKFAHYSLPYSASDIKINGTQYQLATESERFERRKILISYLNDIIETQDFLVPTIYFYYPYESSTTENPANCFGDMVKPNVYGRDYNLQQAYDCVISCMDWMSKTGIEKDIYPLIAYNYQGGNIPYFENNCNNLKFDPTNLNKEFWSYRQLTNEDFIFSIKLGYDAGKQRIKGFLVWSSGYNDRIASWIDSCNNNEKYLARAIYARDTDITALDKITDETYWPINQTCPPLAGQILSASNQYSNYIKLSINANIGTTVDIYRKSSSSGSVYQKIGSKTISSLIDSYYDIDPTLTIGEIYTYKLVVGSSSSLEVSNAGIVALEFASDASKYNLWSLDWVPYGVQGSSTILASEYSSKYGSTLGIVPLVNAYYDTSSLERPLGTTTYTNTRSSTSAFSWNNFKNLLSLIPAGRKAVGTYAWRQDFQNTAAHLTYNANTADGTTYSGKKFMTPWTDAYVTECKSAFTSFLTKCKNEGVTFDYINDDKEGQYTFYLDSGGCDSAVGDPRYFKAIVADSRFTTKVSPITGLTFAEEFIQNFNTLTGRNLLVTDVNLLLEPFINSPCPTGVLDTSCNCKKWGSSYWSGYNFCTPCDQYGSDNPKGGLPTLLQYRKTTGELSSTWLDGTTVGRQLSDNNPVSGYSLYYQVQPAWNAVADNWYYNYYIKQSFIGALDLFPEFSNVKYHQYEAEPINKDETIFVQGSNDETYFRKNIFTTTGRQSLTGKACYNMCYGLGNIVYPYTFPDSCYDAVKCPWLTSLPLKNSNPNLSADTGYLTTAGCSGGCSATTAKRKIAIDEFYIYYYRIRSGYAITPLNDLERYRWISHLNYPYGGASGEVGIIRYPAVDPIRTATFIISLTPDSTCNVKNFTVTNILSGTINVDMQLQADAYNPSSGATYSNYMVKNIDKALPIVTYNSSTKQGTFATTQAVYNARATLSTGTAVVTLTTGNTSGMVVGQTLTKISGSGAFGSSAKITSIDSSTQFTASVNHATAGYISFRVGSIIPDNPAVTGLTSTLNTTSKILTLSNTNGLVPGQILTRTSSTGGVFASNTTITSVDSPTQITISTNPTTSGSVTFTAGLLSSSHSGGYKVIGYYWTNDTTFIDKFHLELSYKIFVDTIKHIRHHLRSDIDFYKSFAPYINKTMCAGGTDDARRGIGSIDDYWWEEIYHIILSGAKYLTLFEINDIGINVPNSRVQKILDEWRTFSGNTSIIPCSNSTGDTTKIVDRLVLSDVFSKYLISGGRIENTDIYIWRITIPPGSFYASNKVKLTRVGTDTDIPETILIDKNSPMGSNRGVWIKRNISTPPQYTVGVG